MTLTELLALLPDNTTGDISAADLRTVVTELHKLASAVGQAYAFNWTTTPPPAAGRVTMDQPWQIFATKALLSETTTDGVTLTFAAVDNSADARLGINTKAGGQLIAKITGPTVDLGTYREIPIQVTSIVGTGPANNEAVTVSLLSVLA